DVVGDAVPDLQSSAIGRLAARVVQTLAGVVDEVQRVAAVAGAAVLDSDLVAGHVTLALRLHPVRVVASGHVHGRAGRADARADRIDVAGVEGERRVRVPPDGDHVVVGAPARVGAAGEAVDR